MDQYYGRNFWNSNDVFVLCGKNLSEALLEKQSKYLNKELFDLETKVSTRLTKLEKAIDSLERHNDRMDENLFHGYGRLKVDEDDIEKVLEPVMLRLKDVEPEIQDLDDYTTTVYDKIEQLVTKNELWRGQLEILSKLDKRINELEKIWNATRAGT